MAVDEDGGGPVQSGGGCLVGCAYDDPLQHRRVVPETLERRDELLLGDLPVGAVVDVHEPNIEFAGWYRLFAHAR